MVIDLEVSHCTNHFTRVLGYDEGQHKAVVLPYSRPTVVKALHR